MQDATLENADALIICAEWKQFRSPDFDKLRILLTGKVIFDGCNISTEAGDCSITQSDAE